MKTSAQINLARAEIVLTLATIFSEFDMKLHDTTRTDIEVARDYFGAYPNADGKGLRVSLKPRES